MIDFSVITCDNIVVTEVEEGFFIRQRRPVVMLTSHFRDKNGEGMTAGFCF